MATNLNLIRLCQGFILAKKWLYLTRFLAEKWRYLTEKSWRILKIPIWQHCNYVQTSAHVIGECPSPQLMEARVQLFGFQFMEPPFMLPIPAVLKFLQLAGIKALAIEAEEGVKKYTS